MKGFIWICSSLSSLTSGRLPSLFQTRSLLPSALKALLSCCQMHDVLWFCFLGFCSGKYVSFETCTWVLSPHCDWCFSDHRSCLPEVPCPNYKLSPVYPFLFLFFLIFSPVPWNHTCCSPFSLIWFTKRSVSLKWIRL